MRSLLFRHIFLAIVGITLDFPCQHHLEAEDLVLKLADGSRLGEAERLGGLLHGADHGRRAADENLDIGSRSGEKLLLYVVSLPALV